MKTPILAPSILSADFSNLENAIKMINNIKYAEGDNRSFVHIDVMDGQFVPEITYGQPVVRSIRKCTDLVFDVHLMVENPENQVETFAAAGADWITFHQEACVHAHRLVQRIHELGKKAGVAICPSTPVSAISELLEYVDLVLVMTVNPGYGGQVLIPSCLKKVETLKQLKELHGYKYLVSVDGGVNQGTIQSVVDAGTEVIVSGSSFFSGKLDWKY